MERAMNQTARVLLTAVAFLLFVSASALADTCDNFSTFVCANSTPNTVNIVGQSTNGALPVTQMITSGSFEIKMNGNGHGFDSAGDVVILASFTGAVSGSLNGTAFTSLTTNPFNASQLGAIVGTAGSSNSWGFVDLQSALSANGTLTVNMSNVPAGTVLYALALNQVTTCKHGTCTTTWEITNITPNSEAGFTAMVTPEPGTLGLLGTGLIALAGIVRRKIHR
jgi:hypothetical protein